IANGRYIKNDVAATLMIFIAIMTWGAYLMRRGYKLLILSGLMLGIALVTKFSALILLPLMLLLYGIRRWQERRGIAAVECLLSFGVAILIAGLVAFAVYGFEVRHFGDFGTYRLLAPTAFLADWFSVSFLGYYRGLRECFIK